MLKRILVKGFESANLKIEEKIKKEMEWIRMDKQENHDLKGIRDILNENIRLAKKYIDVGTERDVVQEVKAHLKQMEDILSTIEQKYRDTPQEKRSSLNFNNLINEQNGVKAQLEKMIHAAEEYTKKTELLQRLHNIR
ncbi:MAG: hypothetical protein FWB91_00495 [Defluviitaleaceae bacterium]|nr:hypothetical protein [Defluviitaleaceae bacterium]